MGWISGGDHERAADFGNIAAEHVSLLHEPSCSVGGLSVSQLKCRGRNIEKQLLTIESFEERGALVSRRVPLDRSV